MQPVSGLLDTSDARHEVVIQSFAPGQTSPALRTRATPVAFAVKCLIQEIQQAARQRDALAGVQYYWKNPVGSA